MSFLSRKFFIWFISLGILICFYLFFIQRAERLEIPAESGNTAVDSNLSGLGDKVAKIGEVQVGGAEIARFTDLNKETKELEREFGFKKLLHEEEDEWILEKPFMNIFRSDLTCYITADNGRVQVENVAGKPNPKDATLTGNVVIRIEPQKGSGVKESFIYLDDIVYISERSMFSTAGPVRFVNEDAQMSAKGLRLVYNDRLDRLESLRILQLDSLTLRQSSKVSLFSSQRNKVSGSVSPAAALEARQPAKSEGRNYRCIFSKNVVIDTPEQLIAADEIFINNILFSKTSPEKVRHERIESVGEKDNRGAEDVPAEEPVNIVVVCDNGILVTPIDLGRTDSEYVKVKTQADAIDSKTPDINVADRRTRLGAKRIDYDISFGNTTAVSANIIFYAKDLIAGRSSQTVMPVTITAKEAKFAPELNQVVFAGDSLCTIDRVDGAIEQKYMISAPKITADLFGDKDKRPSASDINIKYLTADGGGVKLETVKTAGEKSLGGVKLKCARFDYDTARRFFLATGPGLIAVDNSHVSEVDKSAGRFSFSRPCYAVVEDFDTLEYYLDSGQFIADARDRRVLIDYFPVVDGRYGQTNASAGHIEANLYETADGRLELSELAATEGITYEDQDYQFQGSEMFYDNSRRRLCSAMPV